jgi:hypothetical protein
VRVAHDQFGIAQINALFAQAKQQASRPGNSSDTASSKNQSTLIHLL